MIEQMLTVSMKTKANPFTGMIYERSNFRSSGKKTDWLPEGEK